MTEPVFPVAIVGVGNMGGAMAANLLARHWPVHVCDLLPERSQALTALGATAHAAPCDAARDAHVTIVCVVDAPQTRDVLFGAGAVAQAMRLGRCVMLCPTMAPDDVEAIALELRPFGLHCIDAPMSVYEVHLGSWARVPEEGNRFLTYRELAPRLADHVERLGFTQVGLRKRYYTDTQEDALLMTCRDMEGMARRLDIEEVPDER